CCFGWLGWMQREEHTVHLLFKPLSCTAPDIARRFAWKHAERCDHHAGVESRSHRNTVFAVSSRNAGSGLNGQFSINRRSAASVVCASHPLLKPPKLP